MKINRDIYEKRLAVFHNACHDRGLRVTPQRLDVYSELARSGDHPTAETIHRRVSERLPTITLDTVYRTLGTLEEVGLVTRLSVMGGSARFEANMDRHHHFVCSRCGYTLDVYSPKLDRVRLDNELPPRGVRGGAGPSAASGRVPEVRGRSVTGDWNTYPLS